LCVKDKKKTKTIKEEAHGSSQGAPFLILSFVFASLLISLHAQGLTSTIAIKTMPPSKSLLKFKVLANQLLESPTIGGGGSRGGYISLL
jgi:hypothetical protein